MAPGVQGSNGFLRSGDKALPLLPGPDQRQGGSGVKYVKGNALAGRRFRDIDQLNEWLEEWCLTVADERLHGTTHERPSARFARAEAAAMIPVNERPVPELERYERRIEVPPLS